MVMGKKSRSFFSAVALAFAFLFVGPATSPAYADHYRPYAHARRHHGYRYGAPFYGGHYRHHRPYRLVRVFVYDPFPRWVYRRVYYAPPAYYGPAAPGYYYRPY